MSEEAFYKKSYVPKKRCDIDLTLSENPFGCSNQVGEAISSAIQGIHRYPRHEKELRDAIARYHDMSVDNIILGAGANQLLEDIFRVYALGKGVVGTSATFPEPLAYVKTLGGFSRSVDLNDNFTINTNKILAAIDSQIGLIYLSNPNNPTGIYTSNQQMLSLIEASSVPVVISEVGADFVGDSLTNEVLPDNAIVVRSFSKSHALAGLRVGYLVANVNIIEHIKQHLSAFRVNTLSITAALAAINDQAYMLDSVKALLSEKQKLTDSMSVLGFEVVKSQGQTFIAKVPPRFTDATDFCDQLNQYGAAVVNCSIFKGLENYIRIAPQTSDINERFIAVLKMILKGGDYVRSS